MNELSPGIIRKSRNNTSRTPSCFSLINSIVFWNVFNLVELIHASKKLILVLKSMKRTQNLTNNFRQKPACISNQIQF